MKTITLSNFMGGTLVVYAALMASAAAQEPVQMANEAAKNAEVIEEIAVIGIRSSLEQAAAMKRNSDTFVDVISSINLGRFPDENVAESLQRLTGVQIARERGEGDTVSIRGLPGEFTRTLFNGRTLPSVTVIEESIGTSRNFDFAILPSEFVQSIEVYKQPTADLDEGGLAGTVIVRTPRPFDIGKRAFFAQAHSSWESNSENTTPKMSALFSDIFADGRLGLTVAGSYSKREPETHIARQFGFAKLDEGNGFITGAEGPQDFDLDGTIEPGRLVTMPRLHIYSIAPEERERIGGLGVLQFQATDTVEVYGEIFYSELNIEQERHDFAPLNFLGQGPLIVSGSVLTDLTNSSGATATDALLSSEILTTIDLDRLDIRTGNRRLIQSGDTVSVAFGMNFTNDTWDVHQEISISNSSVLSDHLNLANRFYAGAAISQSPGDEVFSFDFHPGDEGILLDPDAFQILSLNGQYQVDTQDELFDYRIDIDQQVDLGPISSIEYGGKYTDRTFDKSNGRLFVGSADLATILGITDFSPAHGPGSVAAESILIVNSPATSFLSALGGGANVISTWLGSDTARVQNMLSVAEWKAIPGAFTNDPIGIIDVDETILAAYVKANFGSMDGRLSGNFGFRVVSTKQESVGVAPDLTGIIRFLDGGGQTVVPSAEPVTASKTYTEFLPSINFKLDLTDDIVLRAAASRTMSRPDLNQISPTTVVTGVNATIVQQNPNLDPFISNNLDFGIEWYPSVAEVISLTVFQKDVFSLVTTTTEIVPIDIMESLGGVLTPATVDFTVTSLENGVGVTLQGLEFNLQKQFGENFGALFNYTFIDNSDVTRLTASSRNNFNLSAYYETERFGARFSYTWRDEFLADLAFEGSPVNALSRNSLDVNMNYNITQRLSVNLAAINILDEGDILQFTNGLPALVVDSGSRVLFGFKFAL